MRRSTIVPCLTLALAACAGGPTPAARPSASLAASTMAPPVMAAPPAAASGGSLAVGTFVRSREPQLQFCYAETRAASPALAGSTTVAVTLAANGRVLKADIVRHSWAGGGGAESVEGCMLSRVRGWKFPAGDPEDGDRERVHSFAVVFTR